MSVSLPPRPHGAQIDVSLAIVNIVLLLIFFFLVTGQITTEEVGDEVELPISRELPLDQLPRPLLLVTAQGDWMLDGTEVAPDLLEVALDGLAQPVTLHILLDRGAPADQLIAVLQNPAMAERSVRLVTLKERSEE
ncbi:ExbD/TolR family protein [Paracoccus tegillarcae]|uniref:Biopolymer transporter ExbD n=1 Tax=Paracoccus tegillarcae TaxID=1529068 RepID=A0A2K9EXX8_9RHOB|nr:biopolymer transporter ExbD [Paracoccus tegillarcae]AUH32942.1 biopolymer transporter ExbD [Paracoccus tegillarcae]